MLRGRRCRSPGRSSRGPQRFDDPPGLGAALAPDPEHLAGLDASVSAAPVDRVDVELALVALDDDRVEHAAHPVTEHDVAALHCAERHRIASVRRAVQLSTFASTRASLAVRLTPVVASACLTRTTTEPSATVTRSLASGLDTGWMVNSSVCRSPFIARPRAARRHARGRGGPPR